jgi:hypothetical protein
MGQCGDESRTQARELLLMGNTPSDDPIPHATASSIQRDERSDLRREPRMMHCRMCSQRLTRPGKLCRECERELQRARDAGASVGELTPPAPMIGASRMAGTLLARLRSPGPVVAAAFAVGVLSAVSLHVVRYSTAATSPVSVMLERDHGGARVRAFPRVVSADDRLQSLQAADTASRGAADAPRHDPSAFVRSPRCDRPAAEPAGCATASRDRGR